MSEQKRQDALPSKEEKERKIDENNASEQDMQIQLSNTKVRTFQTNTNAIEPVIKKDSKITITSSSPRSSNNNFHLMTQQEEDLTIKVRNTGDALYDLVISAVEKAKTVSSQKLKDLTTRDISPASIAAKKDAHDIATLGENVEGLAKTFEDVMTEIRKQTYSEQVHLLTGYKKLLKEQINVIDSRISMTKNLIK